MALTSLHFAYPLLIASSLPLLPGQPGADLFGTLRIMWADSGYDGAPLARYARVVAAITVEVVRRTSPYSFQVVRRRLARYENQQPPVRARKPVTQPT